MDKSAFELLIDNILNFFELATYFLLVVAILNIVLHVSFLIGVELNVVQPIKHQAALKNAVLQEDLDKIISDFQNDFTSRALWNPEDTLASKLNWKLYFDSEDKSKTESLDMITLTLDDARFYVPLGEAKLVDDYNQKQFYSTLTSYTAIQQTQYTKAKLAMKVKVDFLVFQVHYIRNFDFDIIALKHQDQLPAYTTLEKNSGKAKIKFNNPATHKDMEFSYDFTSNSNSKSWTLLRAVPSEFQEQLNNKTIRP